VAVRAEKERVVEELGRKMEQARSFILTDYRGLNVGQINDLRSILRDAEVEYRVAKNTMTFLAAKNIDLAEDLEEYLKSPTSIAFGYADAVAPAKGLAEFAKDHEQLEIKVGVLNNEVISPEQVQALADLPSREELLGQTAGAFAAPLQGFVNVLSAPLRDFANLVAALRDQREEDAA
jgi:large subunit ribosomal protein L10